MSPLRSGANRSRLFLAIAAAVMLLPWSGNGEDGCDPECLKDDSRVSLPDYAAVPLPLNEPPPGARIDVAGQVGPDIVTQQVMFLYSGFTVTACSVIPEVSAFDPCVKPPGSVLRTVRSGPWVTTYSASTKFEDPIADPLGRRTVQFFTTAPVAPQPDWMDAYIEKTIRATSGT